MFVCHRAAAVLVLFLLSSAAAGAQTLTGRVIDPQGAVIVGADVELSGALLPASRSTRSAGDGTYTFENVAPGRYRLRVASRGFVTDSQDVVVGAGGLSRSITLQVPVLSQDVQVVGTADSSLTKSNVPLRDQPMHVNTISSEYLDTFAVNDLVDALAMVPNVSTYQQYGVYEHYVFRGFTNDAQMVDGVRGEGNRVRSQLSNVERIDVLKGPAAVLSGNEAIGSAVNIVLKKPRLEPEFESSLTAGSWNTMRWTTGAAGRLGRDSLLYRVDVGIDKSDNFRHDPWTKVNITPTLTWQITPQDRLEARYAFNRNDLSGDSGIPIVTVNGIASLADVPRDRRFNTPQDFARSYDHNVRVAYSRPFGDHLGFRNIYSPRMVDDEYWVAESMSVASGTTAVEREFLYFKHARRPWTNQAELNGSFVFGVPHNVLVGWEHQDYHSRTTRSDNANIIAAPIDLYNPVETHQPWADFTVSRYDHTRNYTDGVYLQDHLEFGSRLKAVVMFRGDYTDRTTYRNPVTDGVETEGDIVASTATRTTGRYGVVYQPIERLDLFAQFGTSFKPNNSLQPDGSTLKPETGRQWEVGQRIRFLDDHLHVNAAAFRIERRNVALSRPGGFFDQAGMIRSQGMEAEVTGRWLAWRFTVGYGFTDAKYVDYVTTSGSGVQTVLSGRMRPRVPRNTFSYEVAHTWREGLTLAVSGRTLGDQFLTDANTSHFESYSLLNLAASYRLGRIVYALTASNLADTEYLASTRGNQLWYPGEPRRIMGSIRVLLR